MENILENLRRAEDAKAYPELLTYGTHAMVLRLIKVLGLDNDPVLQELMAFTCSEVSGSAERLEKLKEYLFQT